MKKKDLLKLPSISEVLLKVKNTKSINIEYIKYIIKDEIAQFRSLAKQGKLELDRNQIIEFILLKLSKLSVASIRPVINATGIILHTGLGRAPIDKKIINIVSKRLSGYVNLELNLETGKRGQRQDHISGKIASIAGAEDAIVVNNNAAAVLLSLNELAEGREVIVSRGQLVEI
ncbi:MAG: L-seryl-tRNA(Sec) selenium transferase, partial [Candidatus Neomarinimicrobiota bacterium]|nr:L-seryl-tRNA(Sec) selenium transferase [Candidatus Neomarinimicrobiota bacterium]MED5247820.1 L-seryl-tRNA(Sec) selenium transferase [Candidatus Neomarinimicrobiota bacterium]